jgi:hypothetical protein
METINNEYYVSSEVAKLLKEAGFDWLCRGYYDRQILRFNFVWEHNGKGASTQCSAPTLDVAQRWLREVKGINTQIQSCFDSVDGKYNVVVGYYYFIHRIDGRMIIVSSDTHYPSYEEALEAGIKKCLTLILNENEK